MRRENVKSDHYQQKRNHEDLLKLQAYLDGMARAPLTPTSATTQTTATADAGAPVTSTTSPRPKTLRKIPGQPDLAYLDTSTSVVPTVHVAENPAKPPSFDKIDK